MKLLLALIVLFLVAISLTADYLWKRWVARQKALRESDPNQFRQ